MKKLAQKIGGGWAFFAIVVALYGITGCFDGVVLLRALVIFWELFQRVIPSLVVVFALMFLFNLLFDPKKVIKYLGRDAGFKGWFLAIGAGIIAMGSIYIWYPLLADFKAKGMANGLIATFLYNQAIKIQLLPFLIYYFGWSFTIVVMFYMIIFSVIVGWIIGKTDS